MILIYIVLLCCYNRSWICKLHSVYNTGILLIDIQILVEFHKTTAAYELNSNFHE